MSFTLHSVLSATIWGSLIIIFLACTRKRLIERNHFNIWKIGFVPAILRIILIMEIPLPFMPESAGRSTSTGFAIQVGAPLTAHQINVVGSICLISVIAVIVGFLWVMHDYWEMIRESKKIKQDLSKAYEMLETVKKDMKLAPALPVRIIQHQDVKVCCSFGYFRATIFLTDTLRDESQLYLAIRHELTHFVRHHMWYTSAGLVLACAFWWNPFLILFEWLIIVLCEISCDNFVMSGANDDQKLAYGELIYQQAQLNPKAKKTIWGTIRQVAGAMRTVFSPQLASRDEMLMEGRMTRLKNQNEPKPRKLHVAIAVMVLSLLTMGSLSFKKGTYVYEEKQLEDEGTILISPDDSFYIGRDDSTYDLYISDELVAEGIQIFDETLLIK